MPYTFTIDNNNYVSKRVVVEPEFSQEVLEGAEVLEMTPQEIVEAAEYYLMPPEDYAFTMMLSKKINKKVSQRLREQLNLSREEKNTIYSA